MNLEGFLPKIVAKLKGLVTINYSKNVTNNITINVTGGNGNNETKNEKLN